jgi:hypothetical protein
MCVFVFFGMQPPPPNLTADVFELSEELAIDWKKFDLDAQAVQASPLEVCRGAKAIQSQRDAHILADTIFTHLKRTPTQPGTTHPCRISLVQ